jgi:hypothetical protein
MMHPQAGAEPGQLQICGKICEGKVVPAACAPSGMQAKNTRSENKNIKFRFIEEE